MKSTAELFDGFDANDIEAMIEGIEPEELTGIQRERIYAKTEAAVKRRAARPGARRFLMAAAIAALTALSVLVTACAINDSIRRRELANAESFFEEFGLDGSGLTENELIEIYRDIVSGAFEKELTAKIVAKSVGRSEESGSEREATPDEAKQLWSAMLYSPEDTSGSFSYRNAVFVPGKTPVKHFEKKDWSFLRYFEDGELKWEKSLERGISKIFQISGGAVVFTQNELGESIYVFYDEDSNEKWTVVAPHDGGASLKDVCEDPDGTLGMLCVTDSPDYLTTVLKVNKENGSVIRAGTMPQIRGNVMKLCSYGEGYVLFYEMIMKNSPDNYMLLALTDGDLNVKSEKKLTLSDEKLTLIGKPVCAGGKIYLAAQKTVKRAYTDSEKKELAEWIKTLSDETGSELKQKYILDDYAAQNLSKLKRFEHTQYLIEIDPGTGVVSVVQKVADADGTSLELKQLADGFVWEVGAIAAEAKTQREYLLDPQKAALSYKISFHVLEYRFDENGELIKIERTHRIGYTTREVTGHNGSQIPLWNN
ncbi:MAG: hypothetical protein IJV00_01515 [Clostridia bacterium]|nr:hypothetical protein [Clostridia bacterium]